MLHGVTVVIGFILVAAVLWEVFHDLFHPSISGALTQWVARGLLAAARPNRKRMATVGPLTIVLVILLWVAGLVLGFALIYVVVYPGHFRTATGAVPPPGKPFAWALYISLETLVTLGYGDVVPSGMFVRFLTATEALVGFAIVTASVSSILLIFPAITRARHLSLSFAHLCRAERESGLTPAGTGSDVILSSLASAVTHARIDLVHFPIVYFFAPWNTDASIAKWTGVLGRYAEEGLEAGRPAQVRLAASALDASLQSLAEVLADNFVDVPGSNRNEVFRAMARELAVEPEK